MTTEEIFSEIALHMIEGVMIHEEMASYFAFLRLNGYEALQTERYMDESKSLNQLYSYYIRHYGRLVPKPEIKTIPQVIPDSLYNHKVDDITTNDVRQSTKDIFQLWVEWEKKTKKLYERSYIDLIDNNDDVCAAIMVKQLVSEVESELELAKDYWYKLKNSNFDIVFIMEDQDRYVGQ